MGIGSEGSRKKFLSVGPETVTTRFPLAVKMFGMTGYQPR